MADPIISNSVLGRKVMNAVNTHGVPVTVYVVEDVENCIPCPCTSYSLWNQYDPAWHESHPEEVDCEGTGLLLADGSAAALATPRELQMIIVPRWTYGGWDFLQKEIGEIPNWSWCAVDYKNFVFGRLDYTDANNRKFNFRVTQELPFYTHGDTVSGAIIYLLEPLNKQVRAY